MARMFFHGRNIVFLLIMFLITLSAGSTTLLLPDFNEIHEAAGAIKEIREPKQIVVALFGREDLVLNIPSSAVVIKNKAPSIVESLEVGDTVRIRYLDRPLGQSEGLAVQASSPFVRGRIREIDLSGRKLTIVAKATTHTFTMGEQTVILINGSLAEIEDLRPGLMAKAEYRDANDPQLDLLLIGE